MLNIPDRSGVVSLADDYIRCDSLVGPSIEDGYMTRDEYIVCTWIHEFINENREGGMSPEEIEDPGLLQAACEAAAGDFDMPVEKVMEIERRGRMVRARNVPGFEEDAIRILGPEEAARIMGRDYEPESGAG